MLFNSFAFIFGFLPVALTLTLLARPYRWPAKLALTSLSLIFYAMWRAPQLWILGFSIVFNYFVVLVFFVILLRSSQSSGFAKNSFQFTSS